MPGMRLAASVKARSVDFIDGDLGQVNRSGVVTALAHDKSAFYSQLLWIAEQRTYKRGWAAYKFKEKFGDWPASRFVSPMPAGEAVRAWVRSRQIAFARSKGRSA